MGTVIVAADSGTGALACVRALRAAGYEPFVACVDRRAYAARLRAAAGVVVVASGERGGLVAATRGVAAPAGVARRRGREEQPSDVPRAPPVERAAAHACGLALTRTAVCRRAHRRSRPIARGARRAAAL